jgi:hypothetical protein
MSHPPYFLLGLRSGLLGLVRFRVFDQFDHSAVLFIGDDLDTSAFLNEPPLSNYVYSVIVNPCGPGRAEVREGDPA